MASSKAHVELTVKLDRLIRAAEAVQQFAGDLMLAADRAVYSDDPDVVERLTDRLALLEQRLALMKEANRIARAGLDWRPMLYAITVDGLAVSLAADADRNLRFWPGGTDIPFPNVRNVSAQVRRDRKRLADLKEASDE